MMKDLARLLIKGKGKKLNRPLILLMVVATMTLGAITNSEEQTEHRFRVQLFVSGHDSIKGLVTSYINRELRSLRDVEIVYNNSDWELRIVAMETTSNGRKIGVALSTVTLQMFNYQFLAQLLPENYRKTVTRHTSDLQHYRRMSLSLGPDDDLRILCNEIVAEFDADYLEKERKSKKH